MFVMIYHNGLLLLQIFDYQRFIIVLIQSILNGIHYTTEPIHYTTEWHSEYG